MSGAEHILFVDHAGVLGGAELSLLDIAVAFRDRCEVILFEHGPFETKLLEHGVSVVAIPAGAALRGVKKGTRLPSPKAIVGTVVLTAHVARRARKAALVYTNSPKAFLIGATAAALARRPVIWHLRDILDQSHFSRSNLRLMTLTANARVSRVIANSHATADAFVAAGGRRDLVRVVHNGIDPAVFDRVDPTARLTVRRALGIPDDAFVVGSFSRLHPWKGQRVLLDALETLPDVHALIVGGALFSGEADYEKELRHRATQPTLAGRVHLLGARDDIPALMSACDLIAHTSTLPEPFGRVLVEALIARKPLVASDAGGVREVVQHMQTALLVQPGNSAALASAITRLRREPKLAVSLASAGSSHVRERFTRDAMITGVMANVSDVLEQARR